MASHSVLFEPPSDNHCDACGETLHADHAVDSERWPAQGGYLWARGEKVRYERVPLCASCGSAIGLTRRARWEIEEEEG